MTAPPCTPVRLQSGVQPTVLHDADPRENRSIWWNMSDLKNTLTVGLAWQSLGSENLGVGALAQSQLAILRAAAVRAKLTVKCIEFCSSAASATLADALDCEVADVFSPKKILLGRSGFLKQVKSCDAILDIGEGDSFSDIYGGKRFFFLSLSKFLALAHRKPLVLSPQTIGPFSAKWVRLVARLIMSRAERVFARDQLSMDVLRVAGLGAKSEELIDVAFRLPFERHLSRAPGRVRVGINVSGLLFNGGYTGSNQFGLVVDYLGLITRLIEHFTGMPDVEIHLVAHVLADHLAVEDDYAAILTLHKRFPDIKVAPRFASPSEAKSYIATLDFFTGARMHACIAAFSSGVPVVPMAYSRKFNGLFDTLGYRHVADMRIDDTDTAFRKIVDGFAERARLREEVRVGNAIAHDRLQRYEDYLVQLLEKLHAKRRH